MGSRVSGKLKAWVYAISGIVGLSMLTFFEITVSAQATDIALTVTTVFFIISAVVALLSLGDYLSALLPAKKEK